MKAIYSLAIFGILLLTGLAVGALSRREDQGPMYTMAALRERLAVQPAAWVDRPLRVRAWASPCTAWIGVAHASPCLNFQPTLTDPQGYYGAAALPLASGTASPLLALLRRLPLIGNGAPAPQQPHWDTIGVYRIQIHVVYCDPINQPPCYEALLLDAAPGLPKEG